MVNDLLLKRQNIYRNIEKKRNTKILCYVTSDRQGMSAKISSDVIDIFLDHLDRIGKVNKISLILYTLGGDILAAWNIINLIREFCDELEIIVPNRCRSAGTLMCLGANSIVMTKQATLGPIDPSLDSPMNPIIPLTNPPEKTSVSVESIKGYFDLLKDEVGANDTTSLSSAYCKLVEFINPLVLGDIYRSKKQIRMLATKLLDMHKTEDVWKEKIVSFLCSDSGSHNYTISRTEAKILGLKVEKPDDELYKYLKLLYDNIVQDLEITDPFNMNQVVLEALRLGGKKNYCYKRALIESVCNIQNEFVSEGEFIVQNINNEVKFNDQRSFEAWRSINVKSRRKQINSN